MEIPLNLNIETLEKIFSDNTNIFYICVFVFIYIAVFISFIQPIGESLGLLKKNDHEILSAFSKQKRISAKKRKRHVQTGSTAGISKSIAEETESIVSSSYSYAAEDECESLAHGTDSNSLCEEISCEDAFTNDSVDLRNYNTPHQKAETKDDCNEVASEKKPKRKPKKKKKVDDWTVVETSKKTSRKSKSGASGSNEMPFDGSLWNYQPPVPTQGTEDWDAELEADTDFLPPSPKTHTANTFSGIYSSQSCGNSIKEFGTSHQEFDSLDLDFDDPNQGFESSDQDFGSSYQGFGTSRKGFVKSNHGFNNEEDWDYETIDTSDTTPCYSRKEFLERKKKSATASTYSRNEFGNPGVISPRKRFGNDEVKDFALGTSSKIPSFNLCGSYSTPVSGVSCSSIQVESPISTFYSSQGKGANPAFNTNQTIEENWDDGIDGTPRRVSTRGFVHKSNNPTTWWPNGKNNTTSEDNGNWNDGAFDFPVQATAESSKEEMLESEIVGLDTSRQINSDAGGDWSYSVKTSNDAYDDQNANNANNKETITTTDEEEEIKAFRAFKEPGYFNQIADKQNQIKITVDSQSSYSDKEYSTAEENFDLPVQHDKPKRLHKRSNSSHGLLKRMAGADDFSDGSTDSDNSNTSRPPGFGRKSAKVNTKNNDCQVLNVDESTNQNALSSSCNKCALLNIRGHIENTTRKSEETHNETIVFTETQTNQTVKWHTQPTQTNSVSVSKTSPVMPVKPSIQTKSQKKRNKKEKQLQKVKALLDQDDQKVVPAQNDHKFTLTNNEQQIAPAQINTAQYMSMYSSLVSQMALMPPMCVCHLMHPVQPLNLDARLISTNLEQTVISGTVPANGSLLNMDLLRVQQQILNVFNQQVAEYQNE